MTTTLDQSLINEIVRRILSVAQPGRIILFGSAATGQMTPDSDIDLLVLEREPRNEQEESARLQAALTGLGYPVSVVVMETGWFEDSKSVIGGFAYPAHRYGRVIYEGTVGPQACPASRAEAIARLIEGQLAKADEHIDAVDSLTEAGDFGWAAFWAWRAVLNLLNAVLIAHQTEVVRPKAAGPAELVSLVAEVNPQLAASLSDMRKLSRYVLDVDHPERWPAITREETEGAVALARRARAVVRAALPLDARGSAT
jgi:predicted nucleotidyltransferase/HEPN domain-containing protein